MPTSVHPIIRLLQETLESEGMIPAINTPTVNQFLAEEAAGIRIKVVPKVAVVFAGAGKAHVPNYTN